MARVKQVLLALIVAAILLLAFWLYRFHSDDTLNVTPEAERQIEKAKRQ